LQKYDGFDFMEELVNNMMSNNPASRPTIEKVAERFDRIRAELSKSTLRSVITLKDDPAPVIVAQRAKHSFRKLGDIFHGRNAVPVA
jgi:hypothetical protein